MLPTRTNVRSGAAAVELAVLLPFLALMFAAAVDFARVFHASQVLESAASVGATYASGTTPTVETPAVAAETGRAAACAEGAGLSPALQPGDVTVTAGASATTVTVGYDFPLLTGALIPSMSVRLERTVTMTNAPRPGD